MKAIGNIRSEPKGATSLSADNLNKSFAAGNHWLATDFDRTYFRVRNLAGKRLISFGKTIPDNIPISWKFVVYDGDSMNVDDGRFSRNQSSVEWVTGDAGDVGSFTDGTNYIFAELTSTSYDPRLVPDAVTVGTTTTWPPVEGDWAYKRLLGVLDYDAANGIVQSYEQKVYEDVQDQWIVPDGNSSYATDGANYKYYSLEFGPASARGRFYKNLQIYDWDSPTEVEIDSTDLIMFQDSSSANRYLRYSTVEDLQTYIEYTFDLYTLHILGDSLGDYIGDWLYDNYDGFWETGGDSTSCYGTDISNQSGGNVIIDLANCEMRDDDFTGDGNLVSAAWDERILYNDNDPTPAGVLKWTKLAWYLKFGTDDYFDATNGLKVSQGGYFLKGAASYAGIFSDAVSGITAYLGDGTSGLTTNGEIEAVDNNIVINNSGDYYHLGKQGGTGDDSSYVSGGLMLEKAGKTLTIITGQQLRDTDVLAVWR